MIELSDLLLIPGADLGETQRITGAMWAEREEVTGYQSLTDLDVLDGDGARTFVRGDKVVLVYVGESALPEGTDSETLRDLVGSDGEVLPSRQGRQGKLHVVADKGIAWSELRGDVAFVELFPPTTFEHYRQTVYLPPPAFIQ
ncbi:hypothetical protein D1871_18830 [Nakamurella silvestris]|nr:hypothetical protein D1871_18830 [Nakamurella silvestris]